MASDYRIKGVKKLIVLGKRIHKSGFKGYPGLTNTALKIAEYIPKCVVYVEPFAGLGRVAKHIKSKIMVLNDKSEYACKENRNHFPNAFVESRDFEDCIKEWNGKDTFFLIDPPWTYYAYAENDKSFCDRLPKAYYDKILELLRNSPSHWFVCCEHRQNLSGYEKYYSMVIYAHNSKNYGFGLAKTKLYSNRPFTRYN